MSKRTKFSLRNWSNKFLLEFFLSKVSIHNFSDEVSDIKILDQFAHLPNRSENDEIGISNITNSDLKIRILNHSFNLVPKLCLGTPT